MIYATKERAVEVAAMLNERKGFGVSRAARTTHGWTVIRFSPYSQGSVIEYA